MTDKQQKAYELLEHSMKGKPGLSLYKNWILEALKLNINEVNLINSKFIFNRYFYDMFVLYVKNNHSQFNRRKSEIKLDAQLYKLFNMLKRYALIHKRSSFYPKSLMLISINPNPFNLLNIKFTDLDIFSNAIDNFEKEENTNELEKLYIYLRLFNSQPFSRPMLETLQIDDVICIAKDKCILILYYKYYQQSKSNNKFYKLVVLNEYASNLLYKIKDTSNLTCEDRRVFTNIDYYEKILQEYKQKDLEGISMLLIKSINKTYHSMFGNTLDTTLASQTIQSVPLSIADIDSLYPNLISKELLEKESSYIRSVFLRPDDDELEYEVESFSEFELYEILSFERVMKSKKRFESVDNIHSAIKDIKEHIKRIQSKNDKLIYQYINYLLEKLLVNKINITTFKNYIYTLNKHIFKMIQDINNIRDYEIRGIMQRFENNSYTKNSVDNINRAFTVFFAFCSLKGFVIDIPSLLYPKSLVFKCEINLILDEIESQHTIYNIQRQTDNIKLILLQKKAMILLAFYSGLRKTELRTRRLQDIYFTAEKIYIDVNRDGMKNLGLNLKTDSSLRRVEMYIDNEEHKEIINEWWKLRNNLNKKTSYLFLENKGKKIYSKVIAEDIFIEYNKIIKKVTNRYATFHSLRHSFATYRLEEILKKSPKNRAYSFLELSIQLGHQTPNMTVNKYVHYDFIQLIRVC